MIRFAFVLAALAVPVAVPVSAKSLPTPVIFDTDMWGDIDDVLALAMLHALQDRGEARILAITSSTADKYCASYIDLFDSFYGHGDVPVGLVRGGVPGHPEWMGIAKGKPNFTEAMAKLRDDRGALVFPHALIDGDRAPEAVALLRHTLSAQPDGSVVIIQVGFSTNMARLLASKGDGFSPLDGAALVARKVRLLSVMAGAHADRDGKPLVAPKPEFNLEYDVPSAQALFARWPTPIVVSGFEIGNSMFFRGDAIDRDFAYAARHPVAETYRYADGYWRTTATPAGHLHDHKTFDLTSVLYAIRPDDGYFDLSGAGTISVEADGSSRFQPDGRGRHRYLRMDDRQRARALEAMRLLASQPPLLPRR